MTYPTPVLLLTLLGHLLMATSDVGAPLTTVTAPRRLLESMNDLEDKLEAEKEKLKANEKKGSNVKEEMEKVHHDIKVVTGRRGTPSRLDKLEAENHLQLCFWSESFMYDYAYNIWNSDRHSNMYPVTSSNVIGGGDGEIYGLHFKVPHDMHAFKFIDPPYAPGDPRIGGFMELPVYYFVARVKGPFEIEAVTADYEDLDYKNNRNIDEILYFGKKPPEEFSVKHKEHFFVSAIRIDGTDTVSQVAYCADISARLGTPVSFSTAWDYDEIYATGGWTAHAPWQFGELALPRSICPLVPLQASRCF